MRFLFCVVVFSLTASFAQARIQIGTGSSSVTSGRLVPGLALGYDTGKNLFSATSGGMRNSLYSQSYYTASWQRDFIEAEIMGVDFTSYFGVTGFYSTEAFRETASATLEKASSSTIGPSFQVKWILFNHLYFNIDALYGVKDLRLMHVLVTQNIMWFGLGAQF